MYAGTSQIFKLYRPRVILLLAGTQQQKSAIRGLPHSFTNKEELIKKMTQTMMTLANLQSLSKPATSAKGAAISGASKIVKLLADKEKAAYEEVISQSNKFQQAEALVSKAMAIGLIPEEIANTGIEAALVNYVFDGTLMSPDDDKTKAFNSIISYIGTEIFDNQNAVTAGTYSREPLPTIIFPKEGLGGLKWTLPIEVKKTVKYETELDKIIKTYVDTPGPAPGSTKLTSP